MKVEPGAGELTTAADLGLMHGSPPPPERLVTVHSWQEGPNNRWAFQHVSELVPTAVLERGDGPALPLHPDHRDLDELPLGSDSRTLLSFLQATATDGFILL